MSDTQDLTARRKRTAHPDFVPSFSLDALLVGSGPFKMAMTSRLGTDVEPILGNPGAEENMWQVRLGLTVGVTFGGGSRS